MPLGGIGTYVPTMQEVDAHWTAVNAVGLPKLVLSGGFTIVNFETLITNVDAAISDAISKLNLQSNSAGDRDLHRAALRERQRQFRASVSAQFPGSRYLRSLPKLPQPAGASGAYLKALDDMANLWLAINTNVPPFTGFVPPLTLAGNYPIATFNTDLAGLRADYLAYQTNAQNAEQSRASRDALLVQARERIRQYRQGVVGFLPPGHPLLDTIPAMSPPPGSTPPPANLSAVWNAGTDMADLTWTHPDLAKVDHWEVRRCNPPRYKSSEEEAVPGGNLPVGTMSFSTNEGLVASGSISLFKVYAVAPTGNERGSNSQKVTRP